MNNYHDFTNGKCEKCGALENEDTEIENCTAWVVQVPNDDGGSTNIGYASTAEDAEKLAADNGYEGGAELYARCDYCEWHVGFDL